MFVTQYSVCEKDDVGPVKTHMVAQDVQQAVKQYMLLSFWVLQGAVAGKNGQLRPDQWVRMRIIWLGKGMPYSYDILWEEELQPCSQFTPDLLYS